MRKLIALLLAAPLLFTACHKAVETRQNHVLHTSETGRLWSQSGGDVYVAAARDDCYHVQEASAAQDSAKLKELVGQNKAFSAPADTPVKVLEEAYNERRVEILDGPLKGKTGWVVWELLKAPAKAAK